MARNDGTTRFTYAPETHRRLDAIARELRTLSDREIGLLAAKLVSIQDKRGASREGAERRRSVVLMGLCSIDRVRAETNGKAP